MEHMRLGGVWKVQAEKSYELQQKVHQLMCTNNELAEKVQELEKKSINDETKIGQLEDELRDLELKVEFESNNYLEKSMELNKVLEENQSYQSCIEKMTNELKVRLKQDTSLEEQVTMLQQEIENLKEVNTIAKDEIGELQRLYDDMEQLSEKRACQIKRLTDRNNLLKKAKDQKESSLLNTIKDKENLRSLLIQEQAISSKLRRFHETKTGEKVVLGDSINKLNLSANRVPKHPKHVSILEEKLKKFTGPERMKQQLRHEIDKVTTLEAQVQKLKLEKRALINRYRNVHR